MVNKTTNVTYVGPNSEVTFNITVKNNSTVNVTDVYVYDFAPEEFIPFPVDWYGHNKWVLVGNDEDFDIEILPHYIDEYTGKEYSDIYRIHIRNITNGTYVKFSLKYYIDNEVDFDNYTNVVNVTSEQSYEVSNNTNITVVNVTLNINKTANVTVVGNNTLVNFTIVVNSTSLVNATDVIVVDDLPEGLDLIYVGYKPVSGVDIKYSNITAGGKVTVQWNISKLDNKTYVELYVVVRVNTEKMGNLTNNVTVNSNENRTNVTGNETIEIVPIVLTVNKTANVTVVGNNTEVMFTIKVNNTSRVNATDVVVIDELPNGLTLVGISSNATEGIATEVSTDNKTITWTIKEFTEPVEFYVTVRTAVTGNLTNNVTVNSNENRTNVTCNETIEVVPVNLLVNKTIMGNNFTVNNTEITYVIIVNNTSRVNATNVTVTDELPDGLVYVSTVPVEGVEFNNNDNRTLTWTIKELNKSIEIQVTVRTARTGNLTNNVTVNSNENKTNVTDNETVEVIPVILKVNKTANITKVANNTLVKYTIKVDIDSAIGYVTNLTVIDELPEGLTFVNATSSIGDIPYDLADNVITWNISRADGSIEFYVTVRTAAIGNLTNNATVNCNENRTDVKDNETIDVVPIKLMVNKTANVTVVGNNTEVNFIIKVNNLSEVNATDVKVVDVLPDGLVYVTSTKSGDGIEFNTTDNKTLIWTIKELADSIELSVTVKTTAFGNFTNNVTVNSKENSTPVKDNESVKVVPANLTVVKSVNVTTVTAGESVKFTINVTNVGLINATYFNITDILDSAFEVQEIGNETYLRYNDTERIIWTIPSLSVGKSVSVYIIVKLIKGGDFNNTAIVKAPYSNETNSTVNVTALKIPTHVSVENVTTYAGLNVTIHVNVTSDDNKTFSGNVTIHLPDGSNQTVVIVNGTGAVTWHVPEEFIPGVYNDTANYDGDDVYLPSSGNGTVTVIPAPSGETEVINIKVGPDDATGTVNVTVAGKTYYNVPLVNGEAQIVIPGLKAG